MDDATLPPMPPPRSPSPTLPEHIPQPSSGTDPRSLPEVEKEHPHYSDNSGELEPANSSHDVAAFVPLKEEAPDNEGKLEGGKQKRKRTRYAGLYHHLLFLGLFFFNTFRLNLLFPFKKLYIMRSVVC